MRLDGGFLRETQQLITEEVPEGENKDAAMGRIEQRLDPTRPWKAKTR
jgi:hypothetical protein